MVNVDTVYTKGKPFITANYCTNNSLWGKELTIKGSRLHEFRSEDGTDGRKSIVLSFNEIDAELSLNVTNKGILVEAYESTETDNWVGKKLKLRKTKRAFSGKPVDAVEVEALV